MVLFKTTLLIGIISYIYLMMEFELSRTTEWQSTEYLLRDGMLLKLLALIFLVFCWTEGGSKYRTLGQTSGDSVIPRSNLRRRKELSSNTVLVREWEGRECKGRCQADCGNYHTFIPCGGGGSEVITTLFFVQRKMRKMKEKCFPLVRGARSF